jgi:hypothetical protein
VDARSGQIVAVTLKDQDVSDASQLGPLSVSLQAVTFDRPIGTSDPFLMSPAFGLARVRAGQGGIDLLICRALEDAGSGHIHAQTQTDGFGPQADSQFGRLGQPGRDLAGQTSTVDHELLDHCLISVQRRLVQR